MKREIKKEVNNKKKKILFEITILILGIIAISWIIGNQIPLIKADIITPSLKSVTDAAGNPIVDGKKDVTFNWGSWDDTILYSFDKEPWFNWGALLSGCIVCLAFLKTKSTVEVTYTCSQWEPKIEDTLTPAQKMQRCELCNSQGDLPCSEYQCRSLGRACMMVNDGANGKPLCILNNTQDILPPIITPWEDALLEYFEYTPDNVVSSPDKGVKIIYTGNQEVTTKDGIKCAPPYTPVSFGVQLNEPGKCKINISKSMNYSVMGNMFFGGIEEYNYNHSRTLALPSAEAMAAENLTVENGGMYNLYVRCMDYQGNSNPANFVFKFCISQGPDTTPPRIYGASILNNQPIASGQSSVNLTLYINEPAECKWSHLNKNYDQMEGNMTCAENASEMNAQSMYLCNGNLTGLKDEQNNTFYFRCKDQPFYKGANESKRNVNTQSYRLNLIGTGPLVIKDISPNGTAIYDSTETVKVDIIVNTLGGFDNGNSVCHFSETGESGTYVEFFNGFDVEQYTLSENKQELWLGEGNYTYFIQCNDRGGNIDTEKINFSVDIDTTIPQIVRVYKENEYLKLITDEEAECYYSNVGCSYDINLDGELMDSEEGLNHLTEWNTQEDLHIKCKDKYGNRPNLTECSLTARLFEIPDISSNE